MTPHDRPAALLSSAYFAPIEWYQKLCLYDTVFVEHCDNYQKQTYRNRCYIASPSGPLPLTVPVEMPKDGGNEGASVRISDHGSWRKNHWTALQSAYGDSPFFEYYEDDLRPFFNRRWEFLYDFNEAIRQTMCRLLDIEPRVQFTTTYLPHPLGASSCPVADFRDVIRPKHPGRDEEFTLRPYYQVFAARQGFQPNLSILDLLFNMGPESIFVLTP